jgi:E3 ubiquitin-protein ligase synoviolin
MVSKFNTYSLLSSVAVTFLVANTITKHKQFYPTVVFLTTSRLSRVLLTNIGFVLLIWLGQFFKWLFLGQLKPRETEKAHEQAFYYIATTCLALTVFREHITGVIFALFVICLFFKVFHWLAQSREDYIEQSVVEEFGKQVRLFILLALLLTADISLSSHYIHHTLVSGTSVFLLLALEYLIMVISSFSTLFRLGLHFIDRHRHHRWENKGKYKFYLEIFSELLQCSLYIGFFLIILVTYGMPLHLFRELFLAIRSCKKAIGDFLRYRRLVACLDSRYPNATPEELQRDPQCIICYDDMVDDAKKLPCGHIFHKHCLKSWMERNTRCPYCNKSTLLTETEPITSPPRPQQPRAATRPSASSAATSTTVRVSTIRIPSTTQNEQLLGLIRTLQGSASHSSSSTTTSSSVLFRNIPPMDSFQGRLPGLHFPPPMPPPPPLSNYFARGFDSSTTSNPTLQAFAEYQRRMAESYSAMAEACRELAEKLSSPSSTSSNSATTCATSSTVNTL